MLTFKVFAQLVVANEKFMRKPLDNLRNTAN